MRSPDHLEELKALLRHEECCVSIFLPTHRKGPETHQDAIRLKNLLRRAEEDLLQRGVRSTEAAEMLAPGTALLRDTPFWNHQKEGLALFLSRGVARHYSVPMTLEELVIVGEHFYMRPLLPLLNGDGRYYILAVSLNRLRMLEGRRESVREIPLEDVPTSLAEALKYDDPEKQLQLRTSGRGGAGRSAIFHGHGTGGDDAAVHKKDILRFFQKVDRGIRDLLKGEHAPLVFVGVDYLFPLYKEANSYADLEKDAVSGNPDELTPDDLHRRTWKLAEPHFDREREEAGERVRRLAGTPRLADSVDEVVAAAHEGRIDTLFLPRGLLRWGMFDPRSLDVAIHEERYPGDEDLLDRAALATLVHRGTVYAVEPEAMPLERPAVALLRY